jgi:ricin-type beta-trefoil lectin protein
VGSGVVWARVGGVALSAAAVAGPGQTGPYPVSAAGGAALCWQAAGNGSAVTLEHCDHAVQGQQWTLTSDGVFMNGNGYCLEAGSGDRLFIGFDGQCGGAAGSQRWAFSGGQLRSRAAAVCADPAGPLAPGTAIVTAACGRADWSFGAGAAPGSAPEPGTPRVTAGPATPPSVTAGAAKTAAAEPAADQGGGEQAVLMTVGLLVFGGLLVMIGRRSRRGRRAADGAGPEAGGRAWPGTRAGRRDDSGPYVVDVTEEVRRRRAAQEVADSRPTEPFDVSSIF